MLCFGSSSEAALTCQQVCSDNPRKTKTACHWLFMQTWPFLPFSHERHFCNKVQCMFSLFIHSLIILNQVMVPVLYQCVCCLVCC